jgi:hypothetical protein
MGRHEEERMSSGREKVVLLIALLTAVFARPLFALEAHITLYPKEIRQTMVGWEATAQAGEEASPHWDRYKNDLFDKAVNELDINRLRADHVRLAQSCRTGRLHHRHRGSPDSERLRS